MAKLRIVAGAAALLLTAAVAAHAQQRLTGRVTAAGTGEPLANTSISVPGTQLGTYTGDDGRYTLTLPEGSTQLVARRIGYKRALLRLTTGQTTVDFTLEKDVLQLDRQVITGVATSVASQNAANDIASVTADEITRVPTASIENTLAGRAAGVQVVSNSGAPGGGNQIRIRGVSSVFGSATPLYVVDGVLVSDVTIQTGLNALSAASAAAGSNSGNQDNGTNRIADLNPNDIENIEVLKGASASAIYGSRGTNGVIVITTKQGSSGQSRITTTQRLGTYQLGHRIGEKRFTIDEAIDYGEGAGMTEAEVRANYAACNGFCDYEKQLFGETPLAYESVVTASGGTGNTRYFASGMDHNDGGIMKNTGYRKQSVRLNLNQLLGSKVTFGLTTNLVRSMTRRGYTQNDNVNGTPYFVIGSTPSFFDLRPQNGEYPRNPFVPGGSNPFQTRDLVLTPSENLRFITGGDLGWTAFTSDRQSLQFRANAGYDRVNQTDNIIARSDIYWESADGLPGTVTYQAATNQLLTLNASGVHTWTPASNAYKATTSAGIQRTETDFRSANTVARNVPFGSTQPGTGTVNQVFGLRTEIRDFAAYVSEEFLTWSERLALTGAVRAERSTVNGDANKYYAYPKASASLRLPGMPSFIDELKIRTAFGQAGNQPTFFDRFQPTIAGAYAGLITFGMPTVLGKSNIRPEVTTEVEGGFDAAVLSNRASVNFTLYQRTTKDVILRITQGPSVGFLTDVVNGGQFRNRGVETGLTMTPIEGRSLSWISRTTFSKNIGIVQSLPSVVPATGFQLPNNFGAGYGVGLLQVGKRVTQIAANVPGSATLATVGDQEPDFRMGFSNELSFRGLRLTSLLDWQKGGDMVNITQNVYDAVGLAPDVPDGGADRFNRNNDGEPVYVQDAGFVKLREVSLAYALPDAWTQRVLRGGRQASLQLSGRNLKTWTKYWGVDPEASNFGNQPAFRAIDLAPFPPSRSFFFGIDVSF